MAQLARRREPEGRRRSARRSDAHRLTREDARISGRIEAALSTAGARIGPFDTLIAAQALVRDLIVVTHNMREFGRVAGLRTKDWAVLIGAQ